MGLTRRKVEAEEQANVDTSSRDNDGGAGSPSEPKLERQGSGGLRWVEQWSHNLVKFHAAPEHLKDNEYILRYYRAGCTLKQTLLSIFHIHNETLNIWTHLLGFFVFLGLTVYSAMKLPKVAESGRHKLHKLQAIGWETVDDLADMVIIPRPSSPVTRWPVFVYLVGAMFCLLSSSSCHLLMSHSKPLSSFMLRVDYAGIASLIACSFYPPIYYTFFCNPIFCKIYLISITTMGVATVLVSFIPAFENVEYRPARALLFVSMGLSGVVPCIHKMRVHWNEPFAFETFSYEVVMALLYGAGALIYTTRVPERWMPGKFDLAGASHQIFHVLVLAGAFTHYKNAQIYLTWRDVQGCPAPS